MDGKPKVAKKGVETYCEFMVLTFKQNIVFLKIRKLIKVLGGMLFTWQKQANGNGNGRENMGDTPHGMAVKTLGCTLPQ